MATHACILCGCAFVNRRQLRAHDASEQHRARVAYVERDLTPERRRELAKEREAARKNGGIYVRPDGRIYPTDPVPEPGAPPPERPKSLIQTIMVGAAKQLGKLRPDKRPAAEKPPETPREDLQ